MESFKSNTISEDEDEEKESSVNNPESIGYQSKPHIDHDAQSSSVAENKKSNSNSRRIKSKASSSIWSYGNSLPINSFI